MRIARLGAINQEKPALIVSNTEAVFVDDLITDFNRIELEKSAISKLEKLDISGRNKVLQNMLCTYKHQLFQYLCTRQ